MAARLHSGSVFETVNRFDSQFYALTEEAQEWADQLMRRIGKTFSTDGWFARPGHIRLTARWLRRCCCIAHPLHRFRWFQG